jgi:hypothetical protein
MKRNLQYSVMISILAIGMLGTTAAWAANSGGTETNKVGTWAYVGTRAQGSNVYVDSAFSHSNVQQIIGGWAPNGNVSSNTLTIAGGNFRNLTVITGGATMYSGSANGNTVNITGGNIVMDYGSGFIAGGVGVTSATNNKVNISGGTIEGIIYGGRTQSGGTVSGNTITISGSADLSKAALSGGYSEPIISRRISNKTVVNNNKLVIDGWSGSVLQAENFDSIDFKNIQWKDGGTVLKLTDNGYESLKGTNINLVSLAGGTKPAINQSMYIIKGDNLGIDENKVTVSKDFSAGVALVGTGTVSVTNGSELKYTINSLMQNSQTHLVAQNHAVAAAFVNQGTDLISDSLDTLSRDHKYGVKTFAAVHGNHSKYDVNSDLKINGWSGIVGVGNEKDIDNGDFSWGAFFENGSGTYRTYNSFNGDFFRGDGNVVYNGGGVAARFEQDNGVYTEGSLRAGLLKNEMKDALRDGAGNSYGYKSESTYYGAHIGVGKIISLDADKDLDIYGKFFHTYTEGDTFTVAGDKFDLDGITSDRLRIGARLTTNKENKFSTYYGLAYEYEFNGDVDMRVENMSTPQQSLKGSSYMAEVGVNYQPSSDSPWSFDLSMRGYAGQREGFSGNVQAVYSF